MTAEWTATDVTHGPWELPEGWERVPLREICEDVIGGGTPSKSVPEYWDRDVPWVSPKDMESSDISDTQDDISFLGVENSSAKLVPPDSVLFVSRSGILAHTLPIAVGLRQLTVNQDLKAMVLKDGYDSRYIKMALATRAPSILATCVKKGATVHSLIMERSDGRIELFGGGTPSKDNREYWMGSIPWVSPKDMKRWKIEDTVDHVSQTAVKETSVKLIPEGAVLVVTRGMILAHTWPVAVTTTEVTINQDMKALLPKGDDLLPEYLGYVLRARAPAVLQQVEIAAHGTRRFKTDKLANVVIPDAPEEVQRSIINHLDAMQSEVDRMRSVLDEEERLLDRLERSILEKAFRGEL